MFGLNNLLFYLTVLLTNVIQCITGFAGTVLAMPFALKLVGYAVAKPTLNALGLAASVGVVAASYKSVNKHQLFKTLSIMLTGVLVGDIIVSYVDVEKGSLGMLLGAIVIAFAVMGAVDEFLLKKPNRILINNPHHSVYDVITDVEMIGVLAFAGLVHGMFVCGGPLLVLYADRVFKDKDEFRATLSSIWIVLNGIIMASDFTRGAFTTFTVATLAISMAALVVAVLVGNLIAKKLNRTAFMIITYILMFVSGVMMFI